MDSLVDPSDASNDEVKQIRLLIRLCGAREEALQGLKQRIADGESIIAKGMTITVNVIKDAVEQVEQMGIDSIPSIHSASVSS